MRLEHLESKSRLYRSTIKCSDFLRLILLVACAFLVISCGGGGGGGGGGGAQLPPTGTADGALTYTGNSNPESLSAVNSKRALFNSLGNSQSAGAFNSVSSAAAGMNVSLLAAQSVTQSSRATIQSTTRQSTSPAKTVDTNFNCPIGYVHVKGTILSDGTGSLALTFHGCQSDSLYLTGDMAITVSAVDPVTSDATNTTLAISKVTVTGGSTNVEVGGSVNIMDDPLTKMESTVYNITVQDNPTNHRTRLVNVIDVTMPVGNVSGASYSSSLSGRIYDSVDGYVDISTVNPLVYADNMAEFPSGGGPIILEGADNTHLRITPTGNTGIYLEGDFNGDGRYEAVANTDWLSLATDGSGPNAPPVADAGVDRSVVVGLAAQFTGAASTDTDGDFITFKWTISSRPVGSMASLTDSDMMVPVFTADLEGDYGITLLVTDGRGESRSAIVRIKAITRYSLGLNVVDASYSKPLDKVILVASSPTPALHIYDPVTGHDLSVALSAAPTSVSVGPDGLFAAVGHNGAVSYVDLARAALINTFPVSADIFSLVLAGNGYIYAFPNGTVYDPGAWVTMRVINTTNSVGEVPSLSTISGQTRGGVQPSTGALYVTDTIEIDPLMIHWYDISTGGISAQYRSLTSVSYSACGGFWFAEDGARMYSRCGLVFSMPPPPPYATPYFDLGYWGTIDGGYTGNQIISLADSIRSGRFVAIETGNRVNDPQINDDNSVTFFDRILLTRTSNVQFPAVSAQGQDYPVHGKFVFFDSTGNYSIVIGQADGKSGLKNGFFMMHF